MRLSVFRLIPLCLLCLFLCHNYLYACKGRVLASEMGMVPNSIGASKDNANILVSSINKGYRIIIDDTYYVGKSDYDVIKNIDISGNGKIVLSSPLFMSVARPLSIKVKGITIKTSLPVSQSSSYRFIENKGINYHRLLHIEGCTINGVRIYSHIAEDVDQKRIKDGIRKIKIIDNDLSDVGYCFLRINNCYSEEVIIEKNNIKRFYSLVFNMGLNNEYRRLSFPRIKEVIIHDNVFDNTEYILKDDVDYPYLYFTPLLVEAGYCECSGNEFKNILSVSKKDIALYSSYLSVNELVFDSNNIYNCINIGESSHNEIFKCKQTLTKAAIRIIENNIVTITNDIISKYCHNTVKPSISLFSLQSEEANNISIRHNTISLACSFSFGAVKKVKYNKFDFSENSIFFDDPGDRGAHLLSFLCDSSDKSKETIISIENNTIKNNSITSLKSVLPPDCLGYNIFVKNNLFDGYLPYFSASGSELSLSCIISEGNICNIGGYNGLIYIPTGAIIKDTIQGGGQGFALRMLKIGGGGDIDLCFTDRVPLSISVSDGADCTFDVKSSNTDDSFQFFPNTGDITTKSHEAVLSEETSLHNTQRTSIKTGLLVEENGRTKYVPQGPFSFPVSIHMYF